MVERTVGKCSSSETKFLTFLINFVVRTNPGEL